MIRGLDEAAKKLGLQSSDPSKLARSDGNQKKDIRDKKSPGKPTSQTHLEQVPMMYRAQVRGRCSLQFASEPEDLDQWTQEWIYPADNQQPTYQYSESQFTASDSLHHIKIRFPFRLCSNCGQDSILRPVIGKKGIPFIPGSSVKGIFRRACTPEQAKTYCGDEHQQSPGVLRFHGAYPIGDWAGTRQVNARRDGQNITETRYRMVDVVHPQQDRQVNGTGSATAIALITLYQPTLIFEISSVVQVDWEEVTGLLRRALRQGLGGKTSSGYGLAFIPQDKYPINAYLEGVGVSPLLRNNEPEFRPNLFKATLRGHIRRLLSGVCDTREIVQRQEDDWFGHTSSPGQLALYWESQKLEYGSLNGMHTYSTKGILHLDLKRRIAHDVSEQAKLDAARLKDLDFLKLVLKFAVVMGGLGKSWRRVWHKTFYRNNPTYKRAIGCHWQADSDEINLAIANPADLKIFLNELYDSCKNRVGAKSQVCLPWKEAWNPRRVAVYAKVVQSSQVIDLFHDGDFKTTPAIGGKNPGETRPTSVSCVWHRMLPLKDGQYLEIVTVFHGDRTPWTRNSDEHHSDDQLPTFIKALKKEGLDLEWGTEPMSNKK